MVILSYWIYRIMEFMLYRRMVTTCQANRVRLFSIADWGLQIEDFRLTHSAIWAPVILISFFYFRQWSSGVYEIPNHKSQIPNGSTSRSTGHSAGSWSWAESKDSPLWAKSKGKSQWPIRLRRTKPVLVIEYWNLRFAWYLVLGIWDFWSAGKDQVSGILMKHPVYGESLELYRKGRMFKVRDLLSSRR